MAVTMLFSVMASKQRTVESVGITLEIIEYLHQEGAAGVTEIANALGRSKGTIHGHISTLVDHKHLVKEEGEYQLSLYYLDLGEGVKSRLRNYDVVEEELTDLAEKSGEVAQFAVEEHGNVVYIHKQAGEKAVQTASSPGKREYMHCTSLGKAMLAHLPHDRVEAIVERHGLPRFTAQTITTRQELSEELAEVRERGYAFDREELIEGLRCVACPVERNGELLGAISVSGPARRIEGAYFEEELPQMVRRSANVIEINAQFS
ncbi:IclR family transcriptional regulator [Haloarchaeobius sp. HRN-SO-5]|uniref:IclR family transcriptional regulator n=1 Tax=Haloarchaeobius sp. HRN-SO-5 TaxID=3446118 RepID=UPI003EBE26E6